MTEAANEQGLGIEVIFVGLQGVHPPPDLAKDYQKVVGAIQKKNAIILDAHSWRNSILSEVAGSVNASNQIYNLAIEYDQAKKENLAQSQTIAERLDSAFTSASGEIFDNNKLTAAHRTFSFGTRLKVTNVDNGKSVVVTVNDRGPFVRGRIIDLSLAAAHKLEMIKKGVVKVKIEVIR